MKTSQTVYVPPVLRPQRAPIPADQRGGAQDILPRTTMPGLGMAPGERYALTEEAIDMEDFRDQMVKSLGSKASGAGGTSSNRLEYDGNKIHLEKSFQKDAIVVWVGDQTIGAFKTPTHAAKSLRNFLVMNEDAVAECDTGMPAGNGGKGKKKKAPPAPQTEAMRPTSGVMNFGGANFTKKDIEDATKNHLRTYLRHLKDDVQMMRDDEGASDEPLSIADALAELKDQPGGWTTYDDLSGEVAGDVLGMDDMSGVSTKEWKVFHAIMDAVIVAALKKDLKESMADLLGRLEEGKKPKAAAGPVKDNRGNEWGPKKGLEGPFKYKSGAVLYYDPKEGQYYDPVDDMYLDKDGKDFKAMTESDGGPISGMTPSAKIAFDVLKAAGSKGMLLKDFMAEMKSRGKLDVATDALGNLESNGKVTRKGKRLVLKYGFAKGESTDTPMSTLLSRLEG